MHELSWANAKKALCRQKGGPAPLPIDHSKRTTGPNDTTAFQTKVSTLSKCVLPVHGVSLTITEEEEEPS